MKKNPDYSFEAGDSKKPHILSILNFKSDKGSDIWERNNKQKIMHIVRQDEVQSIKEDPSIFSMDEDVDEVEIPEYGFRTSTIVRIAPHRSYSGLYCPR